MTRPSKHIGAVAVLGMFLLLPAGIFAQQETAAEPAKPSEGIVHTVVEGDTLWDLAAKYLGSPWKWAQIWEQNRFITNPHYIYPGIQVVVVPPAPRDIDLKVELPPVVAGKPSTEPPSAAAEAAKAATGTAKPVVAVPGHPAERYLDIKPEDFVRAGGFTREAPRGIGRIRGGEDPKVGFSQGDTVYLRLDKEIPAGQLLGVYRVRGPIDVSGERSYSGYVKYLIGILQAGKKKDGQATATVRRSFEDLTRSDLISEKIPGYTPVKIVPGAEGVSATVIAGRMENGELATGDFVYLDRGSAAGVAMGNVFQVYVPTGLATGVASRGAGVQTDVARLVVVRVTPDFASAYVADSTESFGAGALAKRGGVVR